ncbi:MAG: hypothetical protein ACXADH_14720, partial [Candidatus Kariarchaeaceae archaeon]
MVFRSIDNCGNIQLISLEVRRDTQVPSGSIITIDDGGSIYIHTADPNKLWYSDLMGSTPQSVNIVLTASDSGVNDAGIFTISFPAIGNENAENRSTSRTYSLTFADNTSDTVYFVIYDNVGNTRPISLNVIEDLGTPSIDFSDVTDPDYDPSGDELDGLDNWYDQGLLTGGFNILSNPSDSLSGIATVDFSWSSTGGDSQSGTFGADGEGTITSVDDDNDGTITITLTAYDNVNNQKQTTLTIRFDNTNPNDAGYVNDTTILHQNGLSIYLTGEVDDGTGSGIQNITIVSSLFPDLVTSGFTDWILVNSSIFDSVITPGENETIFITVYDNVNNEYSYTSYITYHTFNLLNLVTSIPLHVEIDDPGTWVLTFNLEVDGSLIDEADKEIIDRDLDLSQFSVSIDGIDIPLMGNIIWAGTDLTITVDLPDSLGAQVPVLNSPYSLRIDWTIDDLPADISLSLGIDEPNVVIYHDLEIVYDSDDLEIVETDNPEYSLMNTTFYLDYDSNPYSGTLSDYNINLTIDGADASFLGVSPLGGGYYTITFELPTGLSSGLKDIDFNWRYGSGNFRNVIESNSTINVVTYHDITISPLLLDINNLFEIDGDFDFNIRFDVQEENGTHSLESTSSLLQIIMIRGFDFLDDLISFNDYNNGSYFFNFDLFANRTDSNWVGDQSILFRIHTPSGLYEWGEVIIKGHDLQMDLINILSEAGFDFFDPDEQTTFDITIQIRDDDGSGFSPVLNLSEINFVHVYLENIEIGV